MELDAKRLGIAGGLVWGIAMFVTVILSMLFGIGVNLVFVFSDLYIGLDISFIGAILGFIYGFIDGFIALFLTAWIYNKLA